MNPAPKLPTRPTKSKSKSGGNLKSPIQKLQHHFAQIAVVSAKWTRWRPKQKDQAVRAINEAFRKLPSSFQQTLSRIVRNNTRGLPRLIGTRKIRVRLGLRRAQTQRIDESSVRTVLKLGPVLRQVAVARLRAETGCSLTAAHVALSRAGRFCELIREGDDGRISLCMPGEPRPARPPGWKPKKGIQADQVRAALEGGPLLRKEAVAKLRSMTGYGQVSAYMALAPNGRFGQFIHEEADGRLSWREPDNPEAKRPNEGRSSLKE